MRIADMISMCMGNLFRRKMRTLLTIIGVVVGTCSIVAMVSLMLGMNLKQDAMLKSMGDLTRIQVMNYGGGNNPDQAVMDDDAIATIATFNKVKFATPIYEASHLQGNLYSGKEDRYKTDWLQIVGVYAEAMPGMGYMLQDGNYPRHEPNAKKPIQILAGAYTDFEFTDTKKKTNNYRWAEEDEDGNLVQKPFVDMIRDEIFYKTEKQDEDDPDSMVVTREIKVAGRMKKDYNKYETVYGIVMDIDDLKWLEQQYIKVNKIKVSRNEQKGYNRAVVIVESLDDVEGVEKKIQAMGFETTSAETIRKPMQENAQQQQMFLGLMGGISLLVAAIGITNTMIMSIYERTREIGVMKVLGCKVRNIRSVFLLEAGVIGFLGGCLGVCISFAASFAMNHFGLNIGGSQDNSYSYMMMRGGMQDPSSLPVSVIPLWLVGVGILFATLIGLLSGVLPANRAMKISALEAIKHE